MDREAGTATLHGVERTVTLEMPEGIDIEAVHKYKEKFAGSLPWADGLDKIHAPPARDEPPPRKMRPEKSPRQISCRYSCPCPFSVRNTRMIMHESFS